MVRDSDSAARARAFRCSIAPSKSSSLASKSLIPTLHPVVCTSDGRGHPAQAKGKSAGRGGKFARAVIRAARALDDHWIGDLIGAVCMIGAPCVMLILGHAMGWQ